jgi:hypothetical protein
LFYVVYDNWPYHPDHPTANGHPHYWGVNGKAAERIECSVVVGDPAFPEHIALIDAESTPLDNLRQKAAVNGFLGPEKRFVVGVTVTSVLPFNYPLLRETCQLHTGQGLNHQWNGLCYYSHAHWKQLNPATWDAVSDEAILLAISAGKVMVCVYSLARMCLFEEQGKQVGVLLSALREPAQRAVRQFLNSLAWEHWDTLACYCGQHPGASIFFLET